ncbi:type I-E CRISPR-associated protein Cse1/CasA [Deinococcus sp. YIM 77859]|uniref:type I-E CRISPR-associated protein Cse1/CasA n=1 Tax=Deinococcus sp. YIM 77859 TaxID=1540221 RepID=UPI00054E74B7|nr:type I-E CRISPR-associated protein Cse1/CasA [Deinococcus sp. YIM 77859]
MTATFNLLTEPWLPVRGPSGVQEVSLREALTQAQKYTRIDAASPLMTVAALRLCLAVLHRALLGPRDAQQAAQWYREGFPAEALDRYLEAHHDAFDLFHSERPFLQLPGLTPELEGGKFLSHWTRLGAEVGSANTSALFNPAARPGGARTDAIPPAEAARRLLEAQTFMLGGLIKRFTTSAAAAPVATAALVVAEGANLHQTFCLNLVPYPEVMHDRDRPAWEREPHSVAELRERNDKDAPRPQAIRGIADRYAWLSRSILLHPEDEQGTVRFIGFGAGIPVDGNPLGEGQNRDPMVTLVPSGDPKKQELFPQKLQRELLFWRDLSAILPEPQNELYLNGKKAQQVRSGLPAGTVEHARAVLTAVQRQTPPVNRVTDFAQATRSKAGDKKRYGPIVSVSVYGQLSDQGKAFAFRQETYSLPKLYVNDAQKFTNTISLALTDAKKLGQFLRQAVRLLCQELLTRVGEREPHKEDVSALVSTLQVEATYWAQLEAPFRTYLLALDGDTDAAWAEWQNELRRAAWAAWDVAVEGVGRSGPALRAEQKAVRRLLAALPKEVPA